VADPQRRHEAFDSWLKAYGRAWESKDSQKAAELFAEDATYQASPFDKPAHGRSGIEEYWSTVTAAQEKIHFEHEVLLVSEDLGIAHWQASFFHRRLRKPIEVDGIFVVRLSADGRCTEFREWWHLRERDSGGAAR
jgi:ketosteroid isomerase-like protein